MNETQIMNNRTIQSQYNLPRMISRDSTTFLNSLIIMIRVSQSSLKGLITVSTSLIELSSKLSLIFSLLYSAKDTIIKPVKSTCNKNPNTNQNMYINTTEKQIIPQMINMELN